MNLLRFLANVAPASALRADRLGSSAARVVLYHHVAAEETDFVRGLNVTTHPDTFRMHVTEFARHYDIISLGDLISGDLPPRPLLITFDDAYHSVLDVAAPILADVHAPAVLFAATRCIEYPTLMLDNLLCYLHHRHALADIESCITDRSSTATSLRDLIETVLPNLPIQERIDLPTRLAERFDVDLRTLSVQSNLYLDPSDLCRLQSLGFEIGSHTANHVHTRALTPQTVPDELDEAHDRVASWTGQPVRAFSYPFGHHDDATPVVQSALRRLGCRATFLRHARANTSFDQSTWYRVSPRATSPRRLSAELKWLPRLRHLWESRPRFLPHDRNAA